VDLGGDLRPAGRSANHENPTVGELPRIAVLLRRERRNRRRHEIGEGGNVGDIAGAGRDDDGTALPVAPIRAHQISGIGAAHRRDCRVGLQRSRDRFRVALDEIDDFGNRAIAIGIAAVVAVAGQPALPVRRQQAQRVPALRPPRVGDLAALHDHVIDGAIGEAAAHGQAGMSCANDDCGDGTNRVRLLKLVPRFRSS
jgi:hypothetical protein